MSSSNNHFKKYPKADFKQSEKNNFTIFSSENITLAATIKDPDLNEYLQDTIKRMNNGAQSPNGGWYGRMMEIAKDDKSVITSVKRYIEVANQLQSDKKGEIISKIIGQHVYESFVNVYMAFWQQCHREVYIAFADKIKVLQKEDLSQGLNKSYMYVLMQLRQDKSLHELFDDKEDRQEFYSKINSAISNIKQKTNIASYFLEEADEKSSIAIYQGLKLKIHELKHLQMLFETHINQKLLKMQSVLSRYVHVRPALAIQYLQRMDHFIKHYDELNKKIKLPFQKEMKDPVKEMLVKKQSELRELISFHQKLYESYQNDDFIEILHLIIENIYPKNLPLRDLFEKDKELDFSLFSYDADDTEKPIKVPLDKHSQWRMAYLRNVNLYDFTVLEKKELAAPPKMIKKIPGFIPLQILFFVVEDKMISVKIPADLKREVLELFKKDKSQFLKISEYFHSKNENRGEFFGINNYYDPSFQNFSSFFSNEKPGMIANPKILEYANKLSNTMDIFNDAYKKEMKFALAEVTNARPKPIINSGRLEEEKKISWQNKLETALQSSFITFDKPLPERKHAFKNVAIPFKKTIAELYHDLLITLHDNFYKDVKKILHYWLDSIATRQHEFLTAIETLKILMGEINQMVLKAKDMGLMIKFHSIKKDIERVCERRKLVNEM